MHYCYAIVTKKYDKAIDIADDRCDSGEWDYYDIGGRFSGLIPVSKKCKPVRMEGNGLWRNGTELYDINPNMRYTNVARLRNVNRNEIFNIQACGYLNIFSPYGIIMEQLDGSIRELILEDANASELRVIHDYLNDERTQSFYIFVIDIHV